MSGLQLAHIVALSLWAGVLLVEVLLELKSLTDESWKGLIADLHYFIDVLIEIPLIILVLVTGFLLFDEDKVTSMYIWKISCSLLAIAINLFCGYLVFRRRQYWKVNDEVNFAKYNKYVSYTGIGFLPGLIALVIGLKFLGIL